MRELRWEDETTKYWASKICIVTSPEPLPQYDGRDCDLAEEEWLSHILRARFPDGLEHCAAHDRIICTPHNIKQCLGRGLFLEALVLVICWGGMTRKAALDRTYGPSFDTREQLEQMDQKNTIQQGLVACDDLITNYDIQGAWKILTGRDEDGLGWTDTMASKYLHFAATTLGYDNPPVPIDGVIRTDAWRRFINLARSPELADDLHKKPGSWTDDRCGWEAYNRYMTAILCWAEKLGWSTSEVENTIFAENRHRLCAPATTSRKGDVS